MNFEKITEKDSNYESLESKSIKELLLGIHNEDINNGEVSDLIDKGSVIESKTYNIMAVDLEGVQ